ncbi:hypothetical protein ACFOJE_05455 [Azotobacter bryophylli]|uniref:DUF3757 domain-containing protein n=1 Tax=Azotobacter bryophylli TaxID=1986537 RepID=A0ABV7ARU2_9GAMM
MKRFALLALGLACCSAYAQPSFTGTDYSGVYDCTGDDHHEGKYTGTVTLDLVRAQSAGEYGAYRFKLEVPGFGAYPGHAAVQGQQMAVHFANTDQSQKDYGTGIASFGKNPAGKWAFTKYYYQPEYKGGNYGIESCTQK